MNSSIIDREAVSHYHISMTKTAAGYRSVDNNDYVAKHLRGTSLDDLRAIAKANGLLSRWNASGKFKQTRPWKDLNPGQARMAVGNALRAKKRRKEPVIFDVKH